MRILVVSDSHMYNDILEDITKKWKNKVDLLVHCGDSSLLPDDQLLKDYNIVVHGNHDEEVFPHYVVYKGIFVTHGNDYHVYSGYDELIEACKENKCHLCFHGHTHVPTIQVHDGIIFVNPGSAMINRGSYGYGTYAIVDTEPFDVIFYDNLDHHICNLEVLDEGMHLLEEFKKLVKDMK
ncbi:YfcE family phosphodiesterase [uncultured Catenibacterium sp.]|uniref:YfcE family phosphodiesterase n=1 Tax=uncultured Catenibacterium sp. TaxID=286142 RepID=UPI002619C607|nr:YfcE family phosphodiesterase [uncultured Catenibacterium sp.]